MTKDRVMELYLEYKREVTGEENTERDALAFDFVYEHRPNNQLEILDRIYKAAQEDAKKNKSR